MFRHGLIGMGVADGVYQWREQGIDAGEFSRLLMHTALQAVEDGQPDVLKGLLAPPPRPSPCTPPFWLLGTCFHTIPPCSSANSAQHFASCSYYFVSSSDCRRTSGCFFGIGAIQAPLTRPAVRLRSVPPLAAAECTMWSSNQQNMVTF